MTVLVPPQELASFQGMTALEKAVALKDFLGTLERLTNDTKECLDIALKEAADNGEESEDYYVMVKYRTGTSFTPDANLLEEKFPEKFRAWYAAELKTFHPRLTKKAVEALWQIEGDTRAEKKASKEKNVAEMQTIMVEHPVKTQYSLASVAEREKWRAEHEEAEA